MRNRLTRRLSSQQAYRSVRSLGSVAVGLVLFAVIGILLLGLQTQGSLKSARVQLLEYQQYAERRLWDLNALERLLGQGGILYDVQQAILFDSEPNFTIAARELDGAVDMLESYRSDAYAIEIERIDQLEEALITYRFGLVEVQSALEAGDGNREWLASLVTLDDVEMRQALDALTEEWRQHIQSSRQQLERALDGAMLDTWLIMGLLPLFAIVVLVLIVNRRRLAQAVQIIEREQERFRDLFEGAPQAVVVMDGSGFPVIANEAFKSLFGITDQSIDRIAQSVDSENAAPAAHHPGIENQIPEEARPEFYEAVQAVVRGDLDRAWLRLEAIGQDFATLWIDVVIQPIAWAGDRYAQVAMTDVTEPVERERDLEFHRGEMERQASDLVELAETLHEERENADRARADAEEQRRFMQTLLETIPSPIFYKNLDGNVLMCNRAFGLFHGYEDERVMLGKTTLDFAGADFDAKTQELDARLLSEGGTHRYERTIPGDGDAGRAVIYNKAIYTDSQGQPAGIVGVITDISAQKQLEEQLRHLATTDPLTGAFNRRAFMEAADKEVQRALRYSEPLSMLLCDIDHFKRVNDTHGHATGDETLKRFSSTIMNTLRGTDTLGRIGGEEFAILLTHSNRKEAALLANRLRTAVSDMVLPCPTGSFAVTVSIGAAGLIDNGRTVDDLLQSADEALYAAKQGGRNRVVEAA